MLIKQNEIRTNEIEYVITPKRLTLGILLKVEELPFMERGKMATLREIAASFIEDRNGRETTIEQKYEYLDSLEIDEINNILETAISMAPQRVPKKS